MLHYPIDVGENKTNHLVGEIVHEHDHRVLVPTIEQCHWERWDEREHWMLWRRQTIHVHHGKLVRLIDENK